MRTLLMLLVVGMLISAGGCATAPPPETPNWRLFVEDKMQDVAEWGQRDSSNSISSK